MLRYLLVGCLFLSIEAVAEIQKSDGVIYQSPTDIYRLPALPNWVVNESCGQAMRSVLCFFPPGTPANKPAFIVFARFQDMEVVPKSWDEVLDADRKIYLSHKASASVVRSELPKSLQKKGFRGHQYFNGADPFSFMEVLFFKKGQYLFKIIGVSLNKEAVLKNHAHLVEFAENFQLIDKKNGKVIQLGEAYEL